MFNFILAIPAAILKFLASIVSISVAIAFYPLVVIGKLFTTSYFKVRKGYSTKTEEEQANMKEDEENRKEKGWSAEVVFRLPGRLGIKYRNDKEWRLAGADREPVPILLVVRTVQFIWYTVSFPFVLSYCLVRGEKSAPKTDEQFDGYQKSFKYCVYNYACDCKDDIININKTIDSLFIKEKNEEKNNNTDESNSLVKNPAGTSVVSGQLNNKINTNLEKPKPPFGEKENSDTKKGAPPSL